eukprot:3094285-Prymnesium_polylepis.1
MRDRRPIAVRSKCCMWAPRARQRASPGGRHPAMPGGEDASLLAMLERAEVAELVTRSCVVCRVLRSTYSEVTYSIYIQTACNLLVKVLKTWSSPRWP